MSGLNSSSVVYRLNPLAKPFKPAAPLGASMVTSDAPSVLSLDLSDYKNIRLHPGVLKALSLVLDIAEDGAIASTMLDETKAMIEQHIATFFSTSNLGTLKLCIDSFSCLPVDEFLARGADRIYRETPCRFKLQTTLQRLLLARAHSVEDIHFKHNYEMALDAPDDTKIYSQAVAYVATRINGSVKPAIRLLRLINKLVSEDKAKWSPLKDYLHTMMAMSVKIDLNEHGEALPLSYNTIKAAPFDLTSISLAFQQLVQVHCQRECIRLPLLIWDRKDPWIWQSKVRDGAVSGLPDFLSFSSVYRATLYCDLRHKLGADMCPVVDGKGKPIVELKTASVTYRSEVTLNVVSPYILPKTPQLSYKVESGARKLASLMAKGDACRVAIATITSPIAIDVTGQELDDIKRVKPQFALNPFADNIFNISSIANGQMRVTHLLTVSMPMCDSCSISLRSFFIPPLVTPRADSPSSPCITVSRQNASTMLNLLSKLPPVEGLATDDDCSSVDAASMNGVI